MSNSFSDILNSGRFVVTAEVGPPKGTNVSKMISHIEKLNGRVDALNSTDNQSAVMRLSPVVACHLIKTHGVEPILQITCRDRNRLALQSELLGAAALGIKNVLCLTGDHISVGDHKAAKAVFDIDSVQLLEAVKGLNEGRDMSGNSIDGCPDFFCGAVVTPDAQPLEPQLMKFEKKVKAGALFFQTQGIFDLDGFSAFMDFAKQFNVKVLAGIILLTSAGMARYLRDNVPGISVPDTLIEEIASVPKEEALDKGIEIAARMIATIKSERICDGVHIMAIGREELVSEILERAKLEVTGVTE